MFINNKGLNEGLWSKFSVTKGDKVLKNFYYFTQKHFKAYFDF